jgi:predicted transcriptional regulator
MTKVKSPKSHNGKANRHKIRFVITRGSASLETAVEEVQVLIRAKNGWTTQAIANDLGLTKGQVTYRIKKGLAVGERARFRSGDTWVAHEALRVTAGRIINEVAKQVTPKFI